MFRFEGLPRLIHGPGAWDQLFERLPEYGRRVLLVTGGKSFHAQGLMDRWKRGTGQAGIQWLHATVSGEPGPDWVDETVKRYRGDPPQAVVAVGGGSALDAGKAAAAMFPLREPVEKYLEGIGDRRHPGLTLPFIAVPTTAGTGSEASKNAVLSRIGPGGFKKSLRHDQFIPRLAVLDPLLQMSCPTQVTSACGMDAFTQLLEGYTSPQASPLTDALAWKGLELAAGNLLAVCTDRAHDPAAREAMALAAFFSGAVLAHAGLGIVHGLASPLGARYPIAHGVVCGTLLAEATRANVECLIASEANPIALEKYARVGRLLGSRQQGPGAARDLTEILHDWTRRLGLPGLGSCGVEEAQISALARAAGLKTNPAPLSIEQVEGILKNRL